MLRKGGRAVLNLNAKAYIVFFKKIITVLLVIETHFSAFEKHVPGRAGKTRL